MLQAALGQVDGTWVFSELRLILDGGGKVVDLLDGAEQPARAALETDRQVYLVPLGDVDQEAIGLKELPEFYRKKFNLEVTLLKPLPIEEKAWDRKRRQLIAEELVELMLRRLPHLAQGFQGDGHRCHPRGYVLSRAELELRIQFLVEPKVRFGIEPSNR